MTGISKAFAPASIFGVYEALKRQIYGTSVNQTPILGNASSGIGVGTRMKPSRIAPGPGQESVWDYPRPPLLARSQRHIVVVIADLRIVDARRSFRVLETSHPPVYYIPLEDVRSEFLTPGTSSSFCEWKGAASYYNIRVGDRTCTDVAWVYERPKKPFVAIANYVAFYPSRVDACYVDDEKVRAKSGDFYGGCSTTDIVVPSKAIQAPWAGDTLRRRRPWTC